MLSILAIVAFSFSTIGTAGYTNDRNCKGKYQKTQSQLKKINSKARKKGSAAHGYKQNCITKGKSKFWKRRKNL